MSDIKTRLSVILTSEAAKQTATIINKFGSQCDTIVEFGSRGAVSGTILINALTGHRRRLVCVDLIEDESTNYLAQMAAEVGLSYHFWQGHTSHYPLHEMDGLLWDTFHSGGALFMDLDRLAPYIQKYIMVLGIMSFGEISEACTKKVDMAAISRELGTDEVGAALGMKAGIIKFLEKNKDWDIVHEFAELVVLGRKTNAVSRLFPPK
jgi:hypothetical protein